MQNNPSYVRNTKHSVYKKSLPHMLHVKVDIQTRRSFMCITALQCVQSSTYHISSNRADLRVFRTHWHTFFRLFLSHAFFSPVSTKTQRAHTIQLTKDLIKLKVFFYSHHWHTPDELDKKNILSNYGPKQPKTLLAWEYFLRTGGVIMNDCKQLKIFWFLLTLYINTVASNRKTKYIHKKLNFLFLLEENFILTITLWCTVTTRRRLFNLKFASVLIKLSVIKWVVSDESQCQHPWEKSFSACVTANRSNGQMFDLQSFVKVTWKQCIRRLDFRKHFSVLV